MATTLPKQAFLKYDGYRPGIFMSKVKDGQPHLFDDNTEHVVTAIEVGNKSYRRKINLKSQTGAWMENLIRGSTDSPGSEARPVLILANGETRALGKLVKTEDYLINQVSFNKGNIAELLFSAAIVARFLKGGPITDRITDHDVKAIRNRCKSAGNNSSLKLESPNEGIKLKDDLLFHWTLSNNNWKALMDESLWSCWSKIVTASVKYANSTHVAELVDLVWSNRMFNEIKVLADGESDQTGTKVDVRVECTDHTGNSVANFLQAVSLKINGVKQFGQLGGRTHEVQDKLWKEAFDIDLKITESQFNRMVDSKYHINDAAKAIYACYESAAPDVAKALSTEAGIKAFSEFVNQHATKGEEGVFIVDLKGDQAYKYDFKNLKGVLLQQTYVADLTYSTARTYQGKVVNENLPTITVSIKDKKLEAKPLLAIRCKRGDITGEGIPYYRNVFEKQSAFTTMFAKVVKD